MQDDLLSGLELVRRNDLGHHLRQARTWLNASDGGKNSTAISYAAFELRLAVERICLHYYSSVARVSPASADPHKSATFRRMKEHIFRSVGHQRAINEHFEFIRALLRVLEIPVTVATPDLGRLSAIWEDCSAACHVSWNLTLAIGRTPEAYDPKSDLTGYVEELEPHCEGIGWPSIHELEALRIEYRTGVLTDDALRQRMARRGVFARLLPSDGSPPRLIGRPIEPDPAVSGDDDNAVV